MFCARFCVESFALVIQDLKRGESHEKNEPGRNDGNKLRELGNKCKYMWCYAKQTRKREKVRT